LGIFTGIDSEIDLSSGRRGRNAAANVMSAAASRCSGSLSGRRATKTDQLHCRYSVTTIGSSEKMAANYIMRRKFISAKL
jgi:hypothetical protein